MKKLFTLLTLALISIGSAWGTSYETVFLWQSGTTKGSTLSISGGTISFEGSDLSDPESATYNASVTDTELKQSSKSQKLGANAIAVTITLSGTAKFQEGDIIYICGYNPFKIGTSATSNVAGTDISSSLETGTAKGDQNVGSVSIGNIGEDVNTIYLSRAKGTGTGLAAIKIVRPTSVPSAPTLSVADGSIDGGTEIAISGDGTIYYQWSTSETAPEIPTTLPGDWTKGTSTAAPNTSGSQYLYSFSNNIIGNSSVTKGSYTITKTELEAGLSFETTAYSILKGSSFTAPTVSNPNSLTGITYALTGDEGVATVNSETGVVALSGGAGTVTITASVAAQGDYKEGSASYTLAVNDFTVVTEKLWNFSDWTAETISSKIFKDNMYLNPGSKNFQVEGNNQSFEEFTGDNKFTKRFKYLGAENTVSDRYISFKVAANSLITIYGMKSGDKNTRTIVIDDDLDVASNLADLELTSNSSMCKVSYTNTTERVLYLYNSGDGINLYAIKVQPATTSVSVSSYEWATFCSDYALDFTGSDVKAYIVTGEEGNAITKEEVTSVAAGTPLLLNASEGNHDITVAASGTDYSSTNKLQRGADAAVSKPTEGSAWVLGVEGGKAMFQYIDGTPATVSTDKAYLLLESTTPTEARSLFLDDDVTGIKNIKVGSEDNIYYDLQGRRVLYPTKGLYIVNGKKVILK